MGENEGRDISKELDLASLPGVGPATKQKLMDAGIKTVLDLASRGVGEISDALGGDLAKASELINKSRERLVELGILPKDFITAKQLLSMREKVARISTGSRNLDKLLGGGVETGAVTEFYGEYGTGKTQICSTLAVMVQMPPESGGLSAGAIYIDTEGTFRPERISEIADHRGLDPARVLENILVARAYNSAHQELIVRELGDYLKDGKYRLIVLDSAVAHYRAEYLGRSTLAERQQRLNLLMHQLLRIAENYNVAVVITNQVMTTPDMFFGDPTRPAGGHVVAHTVTYRIYLRKAGKNRIARIMDSPYHPEAEAVFTIDENGISDPEEQANKRK
ncbi:MAG: DNA repair and recombination protein RadA [Thaumarchaeota archaeon]|nr:DNA repair and recombination protein RadA [Nitrososphaerota archaeon]